MEAARLADPMTADQTVSAAGGQSVFALLRKNAGDEPGEPAVISEDVTISYGEMVERVAGLAGWLVRRGLVPGKVTGVSLTDEIDHLMCAMALMCLGTPQVNLASHETAASKHAIGLRLGVTQIVTRQAEEWMAGMRTVAPPDAGDDSGESAGAAAAAVLAGATPLDAVAVYRTTSGSTNVPKVFDISLERFLLSAERQRRDPSKRRVVRTSSMEFDSTRAYRMCALMAGATCVFIRRLHPQALGDLCARADVTGVHIGAYKLAGLVDGWPRDHAKLPAFTRVEVGGSRVPGRLRQRVAAVLSDNLWVQYATSEVGDISFAPPDQHAAYPEGLGVPVPGVEVEIVDAHGQPVRDGEIGQARVHKTAMMKNYVDDPVASAAFRNGWFYPKDLLARSADGPLIFHGRLDDMMILNSINIFPSAIEDALESHPDVREAVAYPVKSRVHGQIPVAAVVLKDGVGRDASRLLAHCREVLGIRAPRQVFVVDEIPRSSAGKPIRRALSASHD